jgi:hypothetical protein
MIETFLNYLSTLVLLVFGGVVFSAITMGFLLMLDDGWKSFQRYLRLRALRKHREMYFHNPKFEYMQDYAQADADATMRMYDAFPDYDPVWKSQHKDGVAE